MKVIWSDTVVSDTRIDKKTGQAIQYRLTVFDTGEASCSCPGFIFQSINNPRVAAADKLRYRCKHLLAAFKANDFDGLAVAEAPAPAASPPPARVRPAVVADDGWPDDDTPQLRS